MYPDRKKFNYKASPKHLKAVGAPQYLVEYNPQHDISAYELALIIPFLMMNKNAFPELPPIPIPGRRHFRVTKLY